MLARQPDGLLAVSQPFVFICGADRWVCLKSEVSKTGKTVYIQVFLNLLFLYFSFTSEALARIVF